MKRYLKELFLVLLGISILFSVIKLTKERTTAPSGAYSKTPDETKNYSQISVNGSVWGYKYFMVEDTEKVVLDLNLKERKKSTDIAKEQNCSYLINAGFYDKDYSVMGLFIKDGTEISSFRENNLLNGVLSINYFEIPRITYTLPNDSIRIALQTGPVLIANAKVKPLNGKEPARRMLSGVTGENKLVFLTVFDPKQFFEGPSLAEMAGVIGAIEKDTGIVFADLINLDGGNASAFITNDFTLTETTTVGSYFCIKD